MAEEFNRTIADYLDLQDEVSHLTMSVSTENRAGKAAEIISKANAILQSISDNRQGGIDELTLDLNVVKASGNIIHEEVLKYSAEKDTYNVETFAKYLLKRIGNEEDTSNWDKLLKTKCFLNSLGLPQSDCVNGSFENIAPKPKPPSQKKRREAKQKGPVKAPESVQKTDKNEEGSEIIQAVKDVILKEYKRNGNRPICYFTLTCDPRDFGTTIDNMFQISFLVRDCFIEIINGEDGLPYVKPLLKREKQSSTFEEQQPTQSIISMDMDQWEQVAEVFRIKSSMIDIPNRYEMLEAAETNDDSSGNSDSD